MFTNSHDEVLIKTISKEYDRKKNKCIAQKTKSRTGREDVQTDLVLNEREAKQQVKLLKIQTSLLIRMKKYIC